jgi:hypothetical protein
MDRLKALFSRENLPKLLLVAAVYLLGRMEGEGRFAWSEVFGFAWDQVSSVTVAAAASARGLIGM